MKGESVRGRARRLDDKQVGGTHYKDRAITTWEVVDATFTPEEQVGFYRGNLLKYVMRLGHKDKRLTEAQKAGHYAEKLIERLEVHK